MSSPRRRTFRTFVFRQKETRVGRCNGSSASRRAIERQSQTDLSTQHRYVARRSNGDAGRGGLRCSGQAPAALGTFGLFRIKSTTARNERRGAHSTVDSVSACARLHAGLAFKRALSVMAVRPPEPRLKRARDASRQKSRSPTLSPAWLQRARRKPASRRNSRRGHPTLRRNCRRHKTR